VTAEVLACRDLSVSWEPGRPPTLDGVALSLAAGERVALVGLNGSGKTTLLMALVGLVPHRGEIRICGERLSRRSAPRLRRQVGFLFNVPEDQLLLPTVIEDVALGLVRDGAAPPAAAERALATLARLGVAHLAAEPVHHLSHGQKLRVALAGALVAEPPLLLLDEPTAGLDPPGRGALSELLAGLDAAQLIATHDLELAERLCSRVLLLEGGTLGRDELGPSAIRTSWGADRGRPEPAAGAGLDSGGLE
jgi:cobalt/nickel transport system ATP-binding protein